MKYLYASLAYAFFGVILTLLTVMICINPENRLPYITALVAVLGIYIPAWATFKTLQSQIEANGKNILREFLLHKNDQDAKGNLPVLLEILEDLNSLQQALVHRGIYCPSIEHRCPSLSEKDGASLEISYAQRGHQFYLIGLRLIKNCRKIIFLTPNSNLKETLKTCKKLKFFLSSKENGKKMHLDFMIATLVSYLARGGNANAENLFEEWLTALQEFQNELDTQIEKELPYLTMKENL